MKRGRWMLVGALVTAVLVGAAIAVVVTAQDHREASKRPARKTASKGHDRSSTARSASDDGNADAAHDEYQAVLDRVSNIVEGADRGVTESPIETADPAGLAAFARDWRSAIELLDSVKPPADAAAAHRRLIDAMRRLAPYNDRMADAAPDKAAVKRVLAEGNADAASGEFHAAQCALQAAGYSVVDDEDCSGD